MRLHELTKELDADSKRLLAIAKELGLGVKSHSSNVPAGMVGILKAAWAEELEEIAEKEAKKTKAVEAKAAAEAKVAEEEAAAKAAAEAADAPAVEPAVEPADEPAAEPTSEDAEGSPAEPVVVAEGETPVETVSVEPVEIVSTDTTIESPAEPVAADASAEDSTEAGDEPVAEGEASPDEPQKTLVVTIGGQVALPPDVDEKKAAEHPDDEEDGGKGSGGKTETTGPTRRRGARILGRIELKPSDLGRHRPATTEATEYDPADPTRPPSPKRGHVAARKPADDRSRQGKGGKGGKGAGGVEWVFDPEDNTALSAIRIGHLSGQRRPQRRRPPMRRNIMGGSRRPRRPIERATHGVEVRPPIGVRELSEILGYKTREILQHFPESFDPRDKNAVLQSEHLLELAIKFDREITVLEPETEEERVLRELDERADAVGGQLQPRPPVVAVMGHVDHGKTSLLDALRKTKVAAKEAGGITQRTSAYRVTTESGAAVTFLDTPGHKAFTEMRARGATLTDVAVLVVAAEDGVKEQTQEAIDHAKAAEVPTVVAINKMDLPGADPRMVRQQLASAGVMVEDYGGEVGVVECSAVTGQGLTELVERLALETEILELRSDPSIAARGIVIDSRKDPQLGIVATVVVMDGTLRPKDAIFADVCVGRVRYLINDQGKRVPEAGPSFPVQVVGFETAPAAGVSLFVVEDINDARAVAKERLETRRAAEATPAAADAVTLENLFETIAQQAVTEINVLVKADAHGTLDVLRRTVEEITHPEVRFKVIRSAVGGITEDDVLLASASKAFIIGFAVTADANARAALQKTGVEVKSYEVIYEMTEDLEKALEGELAPERRETVLGHATVREVFKISRYGSIAGSYVTDGIIKRDARVRLTRDGKIIWTGRLESLKRFKDDVREVKENYECGIHLNGYDDIKQEDVIEAFEVIEVKRTLASAALE